MATPSPVTVRAAEPRDEARWRELWASYLQFYEVAVSPRSPPPRGKKP